jgi:hypothetical protein
MSFDQAEMRDGRWGSPKVSSWYAVGLLARNEGDDVQVANKLIANILTKQYTDPTFAGYGTWVASSYHCDRIELR